MILIWDIPRSDGTPQLTWVTVIRGRRLWRETWQHYPRKIQSRL